MVKTTRHVWNEDLFKALEARFHQSQREGKQTCHMWRKGMDSIRALRKDITCASTGRIYNLPNQKLNSTVYNLCRKIIAGEEPILPVGYIATSVNPGEAGGNPFERDPYLKRIKYRGGAYAILMAFRCSQTKTLSKAQICSLGQRWCDEAMMENYHAGRPYGAWKSNKTLQEHHLITNSGGNARYVEGVGFRSQVHRFTLTDDGKQFTDAMIKKFPLNEAEKQLVVGGGGGHRSGSGNGFAAAPESPFGFDGHSTFAKARGSAARESGQKPKSALQQKDEAELRAWVVTAQVHDAKRFKVGKARRKSLHDVCDALETECPGLQLRHASEGSARERILFVTVLRKGTSIPTSVSTGVSKPEPSFLYQAVSPTKREFPTISGLGKTLMTESPAKRARAVPASKAAGLAAMERFAIQESKKMAASAQQSDAKRELFPRAFGGSSDVCVLDNDSDDDVDRKLPARATLSRPDNQSKTQQVIDLEDSSDGESNGTSSLEGKRKSDCHLVIDLNESDEQSVIELEDSQESVMIISNHALRNLSAAQGQAEGPGPAAASKLYIYIDNRERNRNASPRELRIELTRLLSPGGTVHAVWPNRMPLPSVEEMSLRHGDFAFLLEKAPGEKQRLSIALERKRIGDLVQRSVRGCHWKQFSAMRDNFDQAILLVEYDTRRAAQFNSEGEQDLDSWNPFQTLISDESSVFLFFGRSLLSHRAWKVIQTSTEQGSLRAIGALGLMASSLDCVKPARPIEAYAEEQKNLQYRLSDAGIPWQLAKAVAREIGSIKGMEALYSECASEACRSALMYSIAFHTELDEGLNSSAEGWSDAIFRAFFSARAAPSDAKRSFEEYKELVEDHGLLLSALHTNPSSQAALDDILSGSTAKATACCKRVVSVQLSSDYHDGLLVNPTNSSFWTITKTSTPTITMQTRAGTMFASPKVHVFTLSGTDLVAKTKEALKKSPGGCFVDAAKSVGANIKHEAFGHVNTESVRHRRVIIVRGLPPALDAAAKMAGCQPELRVMMDLVVSNLMLEHDIVLIQAIRLKNETELILRQLLLACLHYTFLTEEYDPRL